MVRIQKTTSTPLLIQNGVPQIEVFSVLQFLIAINDLTKYYSFSITQLFFVEDYSITIHRFNPLRVYKFLQETLNAISKWSSKEGFRFSTSKTYFLIFK